MLDFLFAVGQFLCLFGLLFALLLVITKARRNRANEVRPSEQGAARSPAQQSRDDVSSVHEETFATIRVVPIENSRLLSTRKAAENQKDGESRETRKPARRRTLSPSDSETRAEERAVLLIKNARKSPGSDRPRAL